MTQPDLVSKLRELSAHWPHDRRRRDEAHGDMRWVCRATCQRCELESLLGREGQAAPATVPQRKVDFCGAVCMAWEDCGDKEYTHHCVLQADHQGKHKFSCSQVAQPAPSPSTPIVPGTAEHGMNCPATNPLNEEDCTCGLRWRIELQTEREMHNAWRKRAEEAEQREARIRKDVVEVVKKTFGEAHPAQAIFPLILDRALAEQREARIRKDVLREAFLLRPGLPHDGNSAQFREGYYAGLEAYRQAIRSALKEES